MMLTTKIAVNPLPWVLGPDGFDLSPATVSAAVAGIADAGFTAMHADVPAGMGVAEYRTLLSDHGVRPAPGYFAGDFDAPADDLPGLIEAARRQAGVQAELGAVHLKDVHRQAATRAREQGDDYLGATVTEHVWTEPGRGDVDLRAVFAALPSSYQGWFVVEVDVPDLPTKEESTAQSARWILAQPERVASA